MSLLTRYVASRVLIAILSVWLVVVGLEFLFALLDELGSLTEQYTWDKVLVYLLLRLPKQLYMFLPVAILVGVLIGLGSLASTSEINVMRAAGLSLWRLIAMAALPVIGLLMIALLATETVMMPVAKAAETYRWEARTGRTSATVNTARDLWLRQDQDFYRINLARDDGELRGITRYRLNEDWSLAERITAERASYLPQAQTWSLERVRALALQPDQVEETHFSRLQMDLPLQPELIALQAYHREDLTLGRLWHYAQYLESRGQPAGFYWLEFWKKLLLPVVVLSVMVLGASFTFGPLRSVPAGTRVFHGILIGLSVKFAQDLLGPSAVLWGFTPALAVLLPAFACLAWGVFLVKKAS